MNFKKAGALLLTACLATTIFSGCGQTTSKEDAQYRAEIGDAAIKAMTIDGKVYSISNANVTVGYFYNKKMFDDTKITPAKTWDEFMDNCEKLKKKGYTPLSLMTGENSWTTNLLLCSMVGTNGESGNKFMNTMYPDTYQVPEMVDALTKMQTLLQKYTTEDAIGAIYANAANNFCQEQTAMIPNGLWMANDFSDPEKSVEGLDANVGFSVYPENGLISNYDIGYVMCSNTDETKKAATEFLKFITNANAQKLKMEMMQVVPLTGNVEMSEEFLEKNPMFGELMKAKANITYEYMNFDLSAHASVVDAFGKYYPDLAYGTITPKDMTAKLDEAAAMAK